MSYRVDIPIGGLMDWVGSADPDANWLLCDGRAISRTTYAALFNIISTTYGTGDGSTTFNIPDLRGRVAVGPDNMGTAQGAASRLSSNNARGNSSGAQTHTLAATEGSVPVHGHSMSGSPSISDPGHTHPGTRDVAAGGGSFQAISAPLISGGTATDPVTGSRTTGITAGIGTLAVTNHAGAAASSAHNNMQPYVVLNKILRVL